MEPVNGLIILARYPEPGRVKTRLAAAIGDSGAAALCRAFLADMRRRLGADPRWRLFWAFEPPDSPFAADFAGGGAAFPQRPGDLGERMAAAMADALSRGARRVVLVGSDLPHLAPSRIVEAFARIEDGADLVLGPAEDGGYYLVGGESVPPIFEGVGWGGPDVLERTLALARAVGLDIGLVPACYDVDTVEDLRRLIADPVLAELPATRRALASIDPATVGR